MRKRSFRPAFDSLDLRIAPSGVGAPASSNVAEVRADTESVGVLSGVPGSAYVDDGGSDGSVGALSGVPGSAYVTDSDSDSDTASGSTVSYLSFSAND